MYIIYIRRLSNKNNLDPIPLNNRALVTEDSQLLPICAGGIWANPLTAKERPQRWNDTFYGKQIW